MAWPNAVIDGEDYRQIAIYYSDAYDTYNGATDYLWLAVYRIVLLQVVFPELDLLQDFWNAYFINMSGTGASAPNSWLNAVSAINNHVITRGTYTSIDAYLAAEGILVPANWISLSAQAGYTISSAYSE